MFRPSLPHPGGASRRVAAAGPRLQQESGGARLSAEAVCNPGTIPRAVSIAVIFRSAMHFRADCSGRDSRGAGRAPGSFVQGRDVMSPRGRGLSDSPDPVLTFPGAAEPESSGYRCVVMSEIRESR